MNAVEAWRQGMRWWDGMIFSECCKQSQPLSQPNALLATMSAQGRITSSWPPPLLMLLAFRSAAAIGQVRVTGSLGRTLRTRRRKGLEGTILDLIS